MGVGLRASEPEAPVLSPRFKFALELGGGGGLSVITGSGGCTAQTTGNI